MPQAPNILYMSRIYTKTGDKGQTRLVGGSLVSKSNLRIEAYGTIDELGACLGLAKCFLQQSPTPHNRWLSDALTKVQHELFNLGSLVANESEEMLAHLPKLDESHVHRLEKQIDEMTAQLPELKQFILSGGTTAAAQLHIARTVCRRGERALVKTQEQESHDFAQGIQYLNRLSDFLFTAARLANFAARTPDQVWQKQ